MKLIWHIIRKDIIRDRWALLLWALLFVGQVVIGVVARQHEGADRDWVKDLQTANAVLIWLQIVMGYILVARLVQADALIGTSMFWPTRPMSAARLFAAKAMGALLLFGLSPVLLLLPWWLYCDFGWREILWTSVETVGWQLLLIAPAFLVASLTDDLGRVLLWTLLLVIGLMSWIVLLQASFVSSWGRAGGQVGTPLMFTRIWLSALVFMTGGMLIGAHQYLTRRFVRSVVLVVLCLGLIALIGQAWRWNLTQVIGEWHEPALPPPAPGLVDGLTFTVMPAQGTFSERDPKLRNKADARDAKLNVHLRVLGLPDDMAIAAESKPMTWTWSDGMKLTRETFYEPANEPGDIVLRRTYSLPAPTEDPETVQWRKARKEAFEAKWRAKGLKSPFLRDPSAPIPPGVPMNGYTTLPNSFLAKMRAESPAYQANLSVMLYRPEVVVDLPLKLDAQASGQARTFHLRQLSRGKPMLLVTTKSSVAATGLWFSGLMRGEFRSWLFRDRFVALNHTNGDFEWVGENQEGSRMFQVAGVTVHWNHLLIQPQSVIRDEKWAIRDPQWLEHTTLVFLTDKKLARFDREVKTERFEVMPDIIDRINDGPAPAKPQGKEPSQSAKSDSSAISR